MDCHDLENAKLTQIVQEDLTLGDRYFKKFVASMNLYFEGLSARKVQRQLKDVFGEDISQLTIWNWIQKYSKLVSEYVRRSSLLFQARHTIMRRW